MIPNFITWFKNNENTFNTYNNETKEYKVLPKLVRNINSFEISNGLKLTPYTEFSVDGK